MFGHLHLAHQTRPLTAPAPRPIPGSRARHRQFTPGRLSRAAQASATARSCERWRPTGDARGPRCRCWTRSWTRWATRPLVRLHTVTRGVRPTVLAKLEMLNPGGSVKDRIGIRMIEAAEREGLLRPGGTIVEPTSGNTGHGLAIAAAIRGYRCIFVMPDKMSQEKIALLRAYGAEVVITPTAVAPESPESYYSVADRLAEEIPGAFQPNQYWNAENPATHYETTGPELWAQTERRARRLRRRRRHGRHDHRRRPVPEGAARRRSRSSAPTPRAPCTRATTPARTSSRGSAKTSGPARSTRPSSTAGCGSPTATRSSRRAPSRGRRASSSAAPAARPSTRRSRSRARSTTRAPRSSCCCPTRAASTCRRSTPTRGCASTGCSTARRS